MKKAIYCALAMVMTACCLTGCGDNDDNSKSHIEETGFGANSPEEAAETFIKGAISNGELLFTVVPEEYLKHIEDEYYLTESQLKEKAEAYVYNENGGAEIISFEVTKKNDFNDMQYLNKSLSELGIGMSEEAYDIDFKFQNEYDDGENMLDSCFEYNGKWYSWDAMDKIEHIAERADSINTNAKVEDWDVEACTSPEMAVEAYIKGQFEDSSFWFISVPSEFIEYERNRFGLTENEIKEKVIDNIKERNNDEKYKIKYFGDKIKNFNVDSCEYQPYDDKSRISKHRAKILQNMERIIGIEDTENAKWYTVYISFNTVNGYNENDYGNRYFDVFEIDSKFYSYDAMVLIDCTLSGENGTSW